MAFYVPHPTQSAAKAKIDGFQPSGQQHQPPSPSNTFDPSSLFFSGPVFPDPFRNPHAGSGSMDFTETLLSMMPNNGGDQNQQPNQANGQQQIQQQQAQAQSLQQQQQQPGQQQQPQAGQPGAPLNLNIPQNIFDMSHFASPLSAFQQGSSQQPQQQQQQRNTPKTETVDSPASLHTGHGFFDNSGTQPQQSHNPFAAPSSIPSYLNTAGGRPESPTVGNSIGSPSETSTAGPTSPFPTHASHARMHGHRSPSIGPASHSRSRSRGATSRPPASRNGMVKTGGPKRQSISSTPEEPSTALPPPPTARPQAILIPSHPSHPAQQQQQSQQQQQQHHHAHHLSHEFTPHQLSSIGPHPISPLGIHSTQTAPSAWFVPSNGQAANGQGTVEPGSFGIQHQDGIQQSFGQAFQPRSLSLGPNPKPGTSASASVLAGSLGTVPVGAVGGGKNQQELSMDAAAKQAAILNEKRRRRRESHNAVERRRRDNINEKISELSTLLPESMLDPTGTNTGGSGQLPTTAEGLLPTGNASLADVDEKETPAMKANKGIILRKSVEYIRYLQQLVRVQANRNRELEAELAQYRGQPTSMDTTPNGGDPSASSGAHHGDPAAMHPFGMLESLSGIDEDGMSMSGLVLANYSPEDTTPFSPHRLSKLPEDSSVKDGSPRSGGGASEEEEERGRGVQRGRRGYNGNASVSVGHGKGTLGVRDDSAELESAVSDGESRERMMD